MNNITFILNEKEKLILNSPEPLSKIHCCHDAEIMFLHDNNKQLLSIDSIRENMSVFINLLTQALDNKLQLHPSISKDIGYLYNQELQGKPGLTYEKIEDNDYWVGDNYLLWTYNVVSWLYNTKDGSIIFEITPIFLGLFSADTDALENEFHYKEWLKTYKPYISKEI